MTKQITDETLSAFLDDLAAAMLRHGVKVKSVMLNADVPKDFNHFIVDGDMLRGVMSVIGGGGGGVGNPRGGYLPIKTPELTAHEQIEIMARASR